MRIIVKRAKTDIIDTPFPQCNKFRNHIYNVRGCHNLINRSSVYHIALLSLSTSRNVLTEFYFLYCYQIKDFLLSAHPVTCCLVRMIMQIYELFSNCRIHLIIFHESNHAFSVKKTSKGSIIAQTFRFVHIVNENVQFSSILFAQQAKNS